LNDRFVQEPRLFATLTRVIFLSHSRIFEDPHDYWLTLLSVVLGLMVFMMATVLARRAAVRESESRFRLVAEAIPEIVWTAIPDRGVDYCNQRWCDLTGLTIEEALGWGWKQAIHPDDISSAMENWARARQTGLPLEVEYRMRTASGEFRWHLVRATPMRDSSGAIFKWFGCCSNIEAQVRNQQLLEEKVRKHTEALTQAKVSLETEMHERALAQQELNQQNERMVQELTRRSNRATRLAKMAELLQSSTDLHDVISVITGMAPKTFPELRGAVLLFNASRNAIEVASSWADCRLPGQVFHPPDCWALRIGHAHQVLAGDTTAACKHLIPGEYSYFCIPLLSNGESIGVLHFQTMTAAEPGESVLLMANMFAEQVGLSVANLRLREALRNQSIRDPLTGLFNRRYLEETLDREIRRAVRADQPLGVVMIDLDHFKNFNDTCGHDAGDAILRETSSFLTKSVRAEDIVCRYGGEEFVVILPMASAKATQVRAERMRLRLRELTVLHQGRSLTQITASFGVAALPEHGTEPSRLLEAADAALYRAKREGRDRVVVAECRLAADSRTKALEIAATSQT
jgi:diguanylate cyclase (GGDEF)-like protein/PAS domain S-box-containing protein